jgi:hypothetical protein
MKKLIPIAMILMLFACTTWAADTTVYVDPNATDYVNGGNNYDLCTYVPGGPCTCDPEGPDIVYGQSGRGLRDALEILKNSAGDHTVILMNGTHGHTYGSANVNGGTATSITIRNEADDELTAAELAGDETPDAIVDFGDAGKSISFYDGTLLVVKGVQFQNQTIEGGSFGSMIRSRRGASASYAGCRFTDAYADISGGMIAHYDTDAADSTTTITVTRCRFDNAHVEHDTSARSGGAIYIYSPDTSGGDTITATFTDVEIDHNSVVINDGDGGSNSGGISIGLTAGAVSTISSTWTGGSLHHNHVERTAARTSTYIEGGGLRVANTGASAHLIDVDVYNNSITGISSETASERDGYGGGLYSSQGAVINTTRCRIYNNSADRDGGGSYSGGDGSQTHTHSLFYNNSSEEEGGALFCLAGASMTLVNVTTANNTATVAGPGFHIQIGDAAGTTHDVVNTIMRDGATALVDDSTNATLDVDYSNVQGFAGAGSNGNIDSDALLDGSYQLSSSSPCINAGTEATTVGLIGNQTDVNGNTYHFTPYDRLNMGSSQAGSSADTRPDSGLILAGVWKHRGGTAVAEPAVDEFLLLESGDYLLLETDDNLILE